MDLTLATKIVYIAGPLNGNVEANVKQAEEASDELARMGVGFFCPHYRGREHFDLKLPEEYWIRYGIEMLKRSDVMVVLPGWAQSNGTLTEMAEAQLMGLHCYQWAWRADMAKFLRTGIFDPDTAIF